MFIRQDKRRVAKRFGGYLRFLRRQRGWTQAHAGQAVGVDAVTIRRWELGLFSPSGKRIAQVAEAYGVELGALIEASNTAELDDSTAFLHIKGFLDAGSDSEPESSDMGIIALPSHMIRGHSDDYCLRVDGDRLAPDGIHDGDVLLICPDQMPSIGSLCVIDMGSSLCAFTYVSTGNFRVRTATGTSIDVDMMLGKLIGTVAWHVRRM